VAGTVVIMTCEGSAGAQHVARRLQERGADPVLFDVAEFPARARLSSWVGPGGTIDWQLSVDDRQVASAEVAALWVERLPVPVLPCRTTDSATTDYLQGESRALVEDVCTTLTCPVVPAVPATMRTAAGKLLQLKTAGELGFDLPHTLVTNDPEALLDFYCRHDGDVVTKAPEQLPSYHPAEDLVRYTERVAARDLVHVQDVALGPVIVQPRLSKSIEVRATVVGDRVFAAEIHSQRSARSSLDWRKYDLRRTPYRCHELPSAVVARCVRLVGSLRLRYGCIDLVVTPDGRYVFLEVNPDGQFLWIEQLTGLPITAALCDLLLGVDPGTGPPTGRTATGGVGTRTTPARAEQR
jgi:hypothetical protein